MATVRSLELGNAGIIQLANIARPLVIEALRWDLRSAQGPDYGHESAIAAFCELRLPKLRHVEIWSSYFMGRLDRTRLDAAPFVGQLESFIVSIR